MPKRISTARGREFGAGLRGAIDASGHSSRAIAAVVGWHESKLSDLGQGKGGASELEVGILLGACRTPLPERKHLLKLFRESNVKGWWQQYGACNPVRLRTVVGQLSAAKSLVCWQALVVPGFLQTAAYSREVLRSSANIPANEVEDRVAALVEAQRLLWRISSCTFYIHELALSLQVGGRETHGEQMRHLLATSTRSSFDLRVLPASAGAHAGLNGAFTKLDFEKYEPLVWLQNENSSLFVEEKPAVAGYGVVVRRLDEISLDAEQSRAVIARFAHTTSEEPHQEGETACPLQ
ncbi:DUF5753 domain-containing protein [Lentzea sp. CA-135723]|uniref:DUF5753 domain-containing protein n=1 Tax=Lentzea sp. CA-135723 TaxID=3239950 RepID=UPI003D9268DB